MKALRDKVSALFARGEVRRIDTSVTPDAIERAYNKRKDEITSLRQYDRGEKHIDAPNLRDLVQSL